VHGGAGLPIGTLCVVDMRPRDWTEGDVRELTDLARSIMAELELRSLRRTLEAGR